MLNMHLGTLYQKSIQINNVYDIFRYGWSTPEQDIFTIELAVRMADLGSLVIDGTKLSLKLSVSSDEVTVSRKVD